MAELSELVARLQAMTEISAAEAKARINQAYREMAAGAEAIKETIDLGPTVVGDATYAVDAEIVNFSTLRVNGSRYYRVNVDDLEDLAAGEWGFRARSYPSRFFAPEWDSSGAAQVRIYPTPTTAGETITVRASVLPTPLVADADVPALPEDFHDYLVDPGAFAVVLSRDDERFPDSQAKQAEFKLRIKELRGRLNRRVGSGPVFIRAGR